MRSPRGLSELFKSQTKQTQMHWESVEAKMHKRMHASGLLGLEDCISLGSSRFEQQELINYYHEHLSLHFIEALKKKGFRLGLTGAHWQSQRGFEKYALGHAEDRADYQARFLESKINISMNPFAQYHPRIIEGGVCGAFFLVFQVPNQMSWCDIPKEMIPGKHFDYFSSKQELVEKCQYYLERPHLRREMAERLRTYVKERFSYKNLCNEFLGRFDRFAKQHVTKERLTAD